VSGITNDDYINSLLFEVLFGKPAPADKTAVNRDFKSIRSLYWENPKLNLPSVASGKKKAEKPFVSELKKDAIKRQEESQPQSGHVEPQFFPAMGVVKGTGKTGELMIEDLKKLYKQIK
jgi:hypothetical protein